jgi:hypothetical protein
MAGEIKEKLFYPVKCRPDAAFPFSTPEALDEPF